MLTQVESRLLLNVVVRESTPVLKLLPGEDETLLVGRDANKAGAKYSTRDHGAIRNVPLLVLDLGLDVVNGIRGLDFESDGLSGEGLHEDLHAVGMV